MNSLKSFFNKVKKGPLKYIIPGVVAVIVIAIVIGNYVKLGNTLGSVYSIEQANNDIDRLRVGDTIKYDINGYSDWQVLYVDKENGTVDVISKTNAEQLTISEFSADSYLNKLQETASHYVDGDYAIKARSINESEIGVIASPDDYWVAKASEYNFKTGNAEFFYNYDNYELYVLPYVTISVSLNDINNYNAGDVYNYSLGGINEWVLMEVNGSNNTFTMIPKVPVKVNYDLNRRTYDLANDVFNSLWDSNVRNVGNAFDKYSNSQINNGLSSFLSEVKKEIYFVYRNGGSHYTSDDDDYIEHRDDSCHYRYSGSFDYCYTYYYKVPKEKTLGFRPVVTLKLKKKNVVTELSSGIKVGDHIKYDVNNYSNWKVLSVDPENNTVDLVSGGVVKNVKLTGDDGYNNLSDILQDEVNAYKSGSNVVDVRPLMKSDVSNLNLIKDEVNARYWFNSKRSVRKALESNYYAQFYSALTGYYNGDEIELEQIYLYIGSNIDTTDYYYFKYYVGVDSGINNYIAGIRPVITVKADGLKVLSREETAKVEKSSKIADKSFANEQNENNKSYTLTNKSITDSTSSNKYFTKDDGEASENDKVDTSLTTNNNGNSNNNSNESYLSGKYLKHIYICLVLLIGVGIVISVILALICRKIDKLK